MDTTTIPFYKSKVFWSGLAGAAALVIQQFVGQTQIDYPALALALLVAVGGYVATTLRGQNMSTWLGAIGNVIWAALEVYRSGNFTWDQFAIHAVLAVIAYIMPDAKPVGYERADAIKNAKVQGQIVTPNVLVDAHIQKEAEVTKAQANGDIKQAVSIASNKTTV